MHELKERLKKIKWLRKSVRAVKAVLKKAKRPYDIARSTYYLKKKKGHHSDKVRIGFIVQGATSWDKMEDVYEIAKARADIETYLFVVPPEDFDTYVIIPDYTDNFFCNKYPESIKALDENGVCLDLADYHLDYLFYQRPYDYRIPKELRSDRMVKYTKCCYIPYGFTASYATNNSLLKDEFFDNLYFYFCESEYIKSTFVKKYWYSTKKKIRKIEHLGYPSFEKYMDLRGTVGERYVTWTPRWSFDKEQGGSTFVLCKDRFADFIRRTKSKAIFRPHPLIYDELMRRNIMSDKEWNEYLDELKSLGVIVDIESPIDDILRKTDVLISDYSSIVISFFLMGRSIIYYDNGVVLGPDYAALMEHNYVAHSWDDVEKFYDCIRGGNDYRKAERDRYIETAYSDTIGATDRIIDRIYEDWRN
jgi:hypothetical protein